MTCYKCKSDLPETEFNSDKSRPNGKCAECKSCKTLYMLEYRTKNLEKVRQGAKRHREENKDKLRFQTIERKYGLTESEYMQMLSNQEHKCLICKKEMDVPCIDHCHTSNKVRGLLCSSCNLGLGHFKDDKEILLAAAQYLEEAA